MNKKQIKTLFDSFKNMNIIVIGDVMLDAYLWGKAERISPEAPVPVVACNKRENRLGGAANVARNILSMSANPILCSVIGDDEKGKIFLDLLNSRGMSKEGMIISPSRQTTVKSRIICEHQHMLRVDEEQNDYIDKNTETILIDKIKSLILSNKVSAIIFEDYDKGLITENLINEIVEFANRKEIPTLVDPKKKNFLNYNNVSLFKPNFKEFNEGLKLEITKGNYQEIHKAAYGFQKKYGIGLLMITLSELGVFISNGEKFDIVPAEVRDINDVSGAGDTVISVASLCLAARLDQQKIATISNLAGGLVCEKVGVVPIDKKILIEECIDYFSE